MDLNLGLADGMPTQLPRTMSFRIWMRHPKKNIHIFLIRSAEYPKIHQYSRSFSDLQVVQNFPVTLVYLSTVHLSVNKRIH